MADDGLIYDPTVGQWVKPYVPPSSAVARDGRRAGDYQDKQERTTSFFGRLGQGFGLVAPDQLSSDPNSLWRPEYDQAFEYGGGARDDYGRGSPITASSEASRLAWDTRVSSRYKDYASDLGLSSTYDGLDPRAMNLSRAQMNDALSEMHEAALGRRESVAGAQQAAYQVAAENDYRRRNADATNRAFATSASIGGQGSLAARAAAQRGATVDAIRTNAEIKNDAQENALRLGIARAQETSAAREAYLQGTGMAQGADQARYQTEIGMRDADAARRLSLFGSTMQRAQAYEQMRQGVLQQAGASRREQAVREQTRRDVIDATNKADDDDAKKALAGNLTKAAGAAVTAASGGTAAPAAAAAAK